MNYTHDGLSDSINLHLTNFENVGLSNAEHGAKKDWQKLPRKPESWERKKSR